MFSVGLLTGAESPLVGLSPTSLDVCCCPMCTNTQCTCCCICALAWNLHKRHRQRARHNNLCKPRQCTQLYTCAAARDVGPVHQPTRPQPFSMLNDQRLQMGMYRHAISARLPCNCGAMAPGPISLAPELPCCTAAHRLSVSVLQKSFQVPFTCAVATRQYLGCQLSCSCLT